jgi:hypothetical protein
LTNSNPKNNEKGMLEPGKISVDNGFGWHEKDGDDEHQQNTQEEEHLNHEDNYIHHIFLF